MYSHAKLGPYLKAILSRNETILEFMTFWIGYESSMLSNLVNQRELRIILAMGDF